jgi:predicted glycoside hydrolase/deacetylase ChbG (UPF0249 family)
MKIIFRADDLGFSEGVNCGIYRSIVDGAITCTGLMPNMPEAAAGYELVKNTGVEVGQHTNICVGRPLTDPARIPSLVQPNGDFCSSREIRARKEDTIVLEEVELEIQAQLDRLRQITGRDPAYFEGHAVMSPIFFQGLQNVAARNGLLYCDPVNPQWAAKYGIQCSAFYHLDEKGLYDPCRYLFDDDAQIKEKECSVLVFHPGYLDQYILDHSSYTLIRPMETAFLCSESLKQWMKENQVQPMTFTARVNEFLGKDGN